MAILEKLSLLWEHVISILIKFSIFDFLDICLVAFILYSAIKLIRETRAIQLSKGLVLLGLVYLAISALKMNASKFIFESVFNNFIFVIIILFQPEIRHALESVGRSNLSSFSILSSARNENIKRDEVTKDTIITICKTCNDLSAKKTGALIVFEKDTPLGEVIKTGTLVDAVATQELVGNIFFPMSPLHDGAAIIRDGRIYAAGCILPLTQNNNLSHELGTRHRAALGMSEQSDAMVVVISEESGCISVACKGSLERDISDAVLRERLMNYLVDSENKNTSEGSRIKKLFGGLRK